MKGQRTFLALWLLASLAWAGVWGWHFRIGSCRFAPEAPGLPGWFCVPRADIEGWVNVATFEYVAVITVGGPLATLAVLLLMRWIALRRIAAA